jgi:flagellar hook-associated protein 3 FlgL
MRVATISIYKQATYQLGRLTSDLNEANEVVSTNLKISSASDDPSGMKQVLTINSDLAALEQYQVNVDQAQNVLTTAETALDTMADQLSEVKLLCSALTNASASYQERANAAESMPGYLDGLLDLANTDAYGGYVFGGDNNRTTPFIYDDDNNPTSVTYNGSSDPVNISTSRNTTISLDCCGSDLFYEDKITVNATNNKIVFIEDPGTGDDNIITSEATITSGTYSKEELAAAVEDSLKDVSKEQGYGIVYEVEYDGDTNTFSIGTDGSLDTPMRVTFEAIQTETVRISNLETDGEYFKDEKINIVNETAVTEYTPVPEGTKPLTFTYSKPLETVTSDSSVENSLFPVTVDTTNNNINFTETSLDGDVTSELTAVIDAGDYSTPESYAEAVEEALETASDNEVNYSVSVAYDEENNASFTISDGRQLESFELLFSSSSAAANDLGFNAEDVSSKPLEGEEATWKVSNDPGYGLPAEIEAESTDKTIDLDLDDDGNPDIVVNLNGTPEAGDTVSFDIVEGYENTSILPDLGFENESVILETVTSDFPVSDNFSVAPGLSVVKTQNDRIDFTETLLDGGGTSVQLSAVIDDDDYSTPESYAEAVEKALETASAENGNRVNYSVSVAYDEDNNASFTISEDTDTGRQLESFNLLFSSGNHADSSAAKDLGFNAEEDVSSKPLEGEETTWSIWDTVFNLKDALENDDVDGIQRAMNWLDNHYESLTSSISTVGRIYSSTTTTEATISDSDLTLTTQRSTVRDADIVESIMDLKSAQTVYEAALSSTSSVMGLSLVDYMG